MNSKYENLTDLLSHQDTENMNEKFDEMFMIYFLYLKEFNVIIRSGYSNNEAEVVTLNNFTGDQLQIFKL